jgi:protein-disulfide isomerase
MTNAAQAQVAVAPCRQHECVWCLVSSVVWGVELKHRRVGLHVAVVLAVALLVASTVSASTSKPRLSLKASPAKCTVGTSVKFTVSVTSATPPYEVRIYKLAKGNWLKVATASKVSAGKYVAFVNATPIGKPQFRVGYVNSGGRVTAYGNRVTVTVTK